MRKLFMIALFMSFSLIIWGQRIVIKGQVINAENDLPVEFAHVVLETPDTVFVVGTTSGHNGVFRLEKVTPGDYRMIVSSLGFTPAIVSLNGLSESTDLGKVTIETASITLEEVSARASAVVSYSDRQVIFPTGQQRAVSTNGIDLLSAMMLPRLHVNPLTNEVKTSGEGEIVFCINGAKAERADIRGLSPDDIIRVEYHDNPGLRYGTADAVIDYIIRRYTVGGSVNMDLTNSPVTVFGDDQVSAKVNYKQSEFGLNYNARYRHPYHMWSDIRHNFHFTDGTTRQRVEKGIPGDMTENTHRVALNYNLMGNDTYYFTATIRHTYTEERKKRRAEMFMSDMPLDITEIYAGGDNTTSLPAVDLYYYRNLSHKQSLILNIVGTYIDSDSDQTYEERKEAQSIANIISEVDGKKYSLIGEGIYEKGFDAFKLGIGMKHIQSWADNEYTGTVSAVTRMDQSDSYFYSELKGKIDKFSYVAGVGISRSWYRQRGEEDYSYYTFRPRVTLQYNFSPSVFMRLRSRIDNVSPGLSQLSSVEQYVDTLQIRRGNPNLKPYKDYYTDFLYEHRKGLFTGSIYLQYRNRPKAIMEETLRGNNKFILTDLNQKSWQGMGGNTTVQVGPVKNILRLSLMGGVNHYISEGHNYSHTYTNWYYRASVMAMYKKMMATFQIQSRSDSFRGETMHGGEDIHMFMAMYNNGGFAIGGGVMLPFSGSYKRVNENRNMYRPYSGVSYGNDFSRMVILKFNWNFHFGRKIKGGEKKLYNEDSDSGILR